MLGRIIKGSSARVVDAPLPPPDKAAPRLDSGCSSPHSVNSALGAACRPTEAGLHFKNISFSVKVKGGPIKQLLKNATGACKPSSLTAVCGPSGCGKTTLLDVLGGAEYGGALSGQIFVDGQPIALWSRTHNIAYVMQHDVLPVLDTPREALTTSALLRLPASMPREHKLEQVQELLEILDLEAVADIMIGDCTVGLRGLSGGQRRRVTIGIELVKNPEIVLLDEPLSGLDSEMSDQVADSLARLAHQYNKMVVFSLHQASRNVERFVDRLILMAGGEVCYCGPYLSAADYLCALGHKMQPHQSPAEFMLAVLKDPKDAAAAAAAYQLLLSAGSGHSAGGAESPPPPELLGALPEDEEAATATAAAATDAAATTAAVQKTHLAMSANKRHTVLRRSFAIQHSASLRSDASSAEVGLEHRSKGAIAATGWQQFVVLLGRSGRWMVRDRVGTASQLATKFFCGVLLGLIFWGLTDNLDGGIQSRLGSLWMINSSICFLYTNMAVNAWQKERVLVRREAGTHLYSVTTFFASHCAKYLLWLPLNGLVSLPFIYFMMQLQLKADKFFIFFLISLIVALTGHLLGDIIAFITPDGATATSLLMAVGLMLVATNGFLCGQVPVYLRWVEQSSYVAFSYTGMVMNEFTGLTLFVSNTPINVAGLELPESNRLSAHDPLVSWGLTMVAKVCSNIEGLTQYLGLGDRAVTFQGIPPNIHLPHASWDLWAIVGVLGGTLAAFVVVTYASLAVVARLRRI